MDKLIQYNTKEYHDYLAKGYICWFVYDDGICLLRKVA